MSETPAHDTELARLQARVALLEAAFDAAPTPMQIFDKDGISLRMNSAQQAFLGLPSAEIGVGEFNVLTDPFSVQTGNAPLFARAYTGESVDCPEQEVDLSEAHTHWPVTVRRARYQQRLVPVSDGGGNVRAVVAFLEDVTALRALEQSNRELQHFIHLASHDLRAPILTICGNIMMLREDLSRRITEDESSMLQLIQSSADRMEGLLNDLLRYSRTGNAAPAMEPLDLGLLLSRVRQDLQGAIARSGATLHVATELPQVRGDETMISSLLLNLVGNAIHYHREAVPPVVHVTGSTVDSSWIQLTVTDNGQGIAAEHIERIFLPFERLHARQERTGTGLGLSIVRRIVELHGGRVTVESRPGQGSSFHVTLPTAQT